MSTEVWFSSLVGAAVGVVAPTSSGIELPTAAHALVLLDDVATAVDVVFSSIDERHLERATSVDRTVASVMRWSAWHLRDHAKQMLGVQ